MPSKGSGSSPRPRPRQGGGDAGGDALRAGARAVKTRAAETVTRVSRKLRDGGERLLDERKRRAADGLREVGRTIRKTASQLHAGPLEGVGSYVEAAAEGVTHASRYLDEQDLQALVRDAGRVVRRAPQWFLPGMFLAGLLLARFAKATEDEPRRRRTATRGATAARPPRK